MTLYQYIKHYAKIIIRERKAPPLPFFFSARNSIPNSELFLLWHNGLGDTIVCNGLVRYLLKQGHYSKIYLPTHTCCHLSVEFMFSDIASSISLYEFPTFSEAALYAWNTKWKGAQLLDVSMNNLSFSKEKWDQEFYRLAGVPYEERWNSFKIPPVISPVELPEKFIFIHDDSSRGWSINIKSDLPIIRPKNIGHAFLWLPAIQKAEEIHCIDSSFFHMVESVETKTNKLFFHNIRPVAYPASVFRKNWTICRP